MLRLGWALLLLGSCGPSPRVLVSDAIMGGRPVGPDEAAAQRTVYLHIEMEGGHEGICTGSLLGNHFILTAAHCVNPDFGFRRVWALFGTDLRGTGSPERLNIDEVAIHPGYFEALESQEGPLHDIALLYFKGTAPAQMQSNEVLDWGLNFSFWRDMAGPTPLMRPQWELES